jgi:hypothetical protein
MNKSIIEMAHEVYGDEKFWTGEQLLKLKAFAKLVREDERKQIAQWYDNTGQILMRHEVPDAIRARGQ